MNDTTSNFPFEVAYDHFAHKIVTLGLPPPSADMQMPPFMALVAIYDGKAARVEVNPISASMMMAGVDGVQDIITQTMAMVASQGEAGENFCLVIGMEAMVVCRKVGKGDATPTLKEMASDPDQRPALVLKVHRPEGVRIGILPIDENGQVAYSPLMPGLASLDSATDIGGATPPAGQQVH